LNFIDDVLAGRVTLPMVPDVVIRLLGVMRQDDAGLGQIADELELDPVLSSRVLRMANSSFYSGRRSMASISDAVSSVGFKSLETLVIASAAQAAFAQVPGVNLRQFWLLAVATATSARQVARRLRADADTAYSAGLLQGVGHLILCQHHPDDAEEAFSSMRSLWGAPLAAREQALWGVDHAQVSALWVDKLGMPAAVGEAIARSVDPLGGQHHTHHTLGRVVQLACHVAGAISTGDSAEQAARAIDAALVELLDLDQYLEGDDFADDFANLKGLPALA
jgi:HD-like signal output (HDOD) protein